MMDELLARYGVGNVGLQLNQDQDQRLVVNEKVRSEIEGTRIFLSCQLFNYAAEAV